MPMRLPIDISEIALTDRYDGWKFSARTNPPLRVLADLSSGDLDLLASSLATIIKSWNFVDEEGQPLSSPTSDVIMDLPSDLINAIANAYVEAVSALSPS